MNNKNKAMLTKLIRCILIISIIFSMHKLNAQNYDSLFIGLADIKRGMAIGEIGAGGGDFAIKILQVVGDKGIVYANEISNDAIEYIRSKEVANLIPVLGGNDDPLFPCQNLDLVIMKNVFHDLENPLLLLENTGKYLKKDASLIIIEPHPIPNRYLSPRTHHEMQRVDLINILKKSAFVPIKSDTTLANWWSIYYLKIDSTKASEIWDNWQVEFEKSVNLLTKGEWPPQLKSRIEVVAWERLLNDFRDDNSKTNRDNELRQKITNLINKFETRQSSILDGNQVFKIAQETGFKGDVRLREGDFVNDIAQLVMKGDTLLHDRASNLMWIPVATDSLLDYFSGLECIEKLNIIKYASYSDWRLPSIRELLTIFETKRQSNHTYLNESFNIPCGIVWCSDLSYPGRAWVINYTTSMMQFWDNLKINKAWLMAVRTFQ